MSFFYFTAVKGDIPVHLLEDIAVKRLRYLKAIMREDNLVYSEYMVEGSIYDNIGHFILCVVSIMKADVEFMRFFLKSERDLFSRRITLMSAYDLRCFGRKLLRSIRKQPASPPYVDALKVLCEHITIKDLVQHVCSPTHSYDCTAHKISLHFRHCLPMIAKRQVELSKGTALVTCGKWKQLLSMLFCSNLNHRLHNTNLTSLKVDPRLSELLLKLEKEMAPFMNNRYGKSTLLYKNVDNASLLFPPCMLNLHQQLRHKHRLSHTQRFHYSLFLKDIGMPIEEAVQFWRSEYQQNPNGSHSCCHNWDRDEKKYMYGIRHMYGLEGCRKNYASVNCQQIQSVDNACSEGGCPFKVFEATKMNQVLGTTSENPLMAQIHDLKLKQRYTYACILHLQSQHLHSANDCIKENLSFNFTPVKYYENASQKMDLL